MVEADIFSRSGCEDLVNRAVAAVGTLDILVSNPAYAVRCEFLDYEPEVFEKVIQGTLVSGFHVAQLTARQMVKSKTPGKIVFISSVQAAMPYRLSVGYNAGKAGLNHMARTIAVELTEHSIRVNVIEPGWIDTPGERQSYADDTMEEEAKKLPWGRMGTPEDIGKATTFLSTNDSDYITGTFLAVDGGYQFKHCRDIPDEK